MTNRGMDQGLMMRRRRWKWTTMGMLITTLSGT
jgi:hypothetical protein